MFLIHSTERFKFPWIYTRNIIPYMLSIVIENVINICSYREIGFKVADIEDGNVKISCNLGELELGKLDKEYFDDPDLESILQETELDIEKMRRFENEKLYLIYSVIYSERFELRGKRQNEVTRKLHDVMFRLSAPLPTSAHSSIFISATSNRRPLFQ